MYDVLNDSELVELDKAIRFLNPVSEQEINGKVAQWKAGTLTAPDLSQALNFHEYVVKQVREAWKPLLKQM